MKSSKNIFMSWFKFSLKVLLTALWKVSGPFLAPNNITIQTKIPQSITKIILYLSSGAIKI
jgi:hypothetical protein